MKYETLWRRLTGIYDTDEAKAIVRWVLDERFGLSLTDIVCGKIDELNETECKTLEAMMQRLETGEPVQYVMGTAEFCGRRFHVAPGVLIPRPETEELCEWIMASDKHGQTRTNDSVAEKAVQENSLLSDANILDVGTGSGCIAITLALEMPEAKVTAWDISEEALSIAKKNAKALKADVTFEKHDILDFESHLEEQNISLTSHLSPLTSKSWDVIVSNPPYVCQKEAATMEKHVLEHEPHLALFVPDNDPLRFYRAIAQYATTALKPGGLLYFELNPLYAHDISDMLRMMSWHDITLRQDQFGKQRFLKAKKI
jgi:release factor glutamine methyltransferase